MAKRALKRTGRSARARGLRTLQHQSLPSATRFAIDTEAWFRALVLEQWADADGPPDVHWGTKDRVHDEAIAWFLDRQGSRPVEQRTRAGPLQDLTFWLDSRLLARARRLAARSGIRLAQLIELAMSAYVAAHVSEELLAFRRRVRADAARLYRARMRAGARTGAARERARSDARARSTRSTSARG